MHPLEALNEAELGSLIRIADRLLTTDHLLSPGHRSSRTQTGFGIEFLDHREFSPGDDIRKIDWRATARSRHPQIRRYHSETAADWFIALDCSASMAIADGEKWALALQCTAAMAYLLIHLDNRVGILLFSDRVEQMLPLGRGYTHYASILQMLHRTTPPPSGGGSDLRSCVSRIKRHSPVFVISDFLTVDHMQGGLDALSVRGDKLHALQILSEHDYRLPAESRVRFKDIETADSIMTDLGSAVQERYRMAFDAFCAALSSHCLKQRIRFSRHTSDEGWKSVLTEHLRTRNNQR
jgi:uncharacterized protein (DUF58 family)